MNGQICLCPCDADVYGALFLVCELFNILEYKEYIVKFTSF